MIWDEINTSYLMLEDWLGLDTYRGHHDYWSKQMLQKAHEQALNLAAGFEKLLLEK